MNKLVSLIEAAEITGLSRVWLYNLYRRGRIPGAGKVGSVVAVPREWAEAERRRRAESVTIAEAARLAGVSVSSIHAAIHHGDLTQDGARITRESLKNYIAGHKNNNKNSHNFGKNA